MFRNSANPGEFRHVYICVCWWQKKEVDPDKPKRPQSAYFIWLNENRSQIKEKFPGISITELSKRAGEMWKEMTDKSVSTHIRTTIFIIVIVIIV